MVPVLVEHLGDHESLLKRKNLGHISLHNKKSKTEVDDGLNKPEEKLEVEEDPNFTEPMNDGLNPYWDRTLESKDIKNAVIGDLCEVDLDSTTAIGNLQQKLNEKKPSTFDEDLLENIKILLVVFYAPHQMLKNMDLTILGLAPFLIK